MGLGNYIFWSEIGSGFRELGGTTPPRIPRSTPPPPPPSVPPRNCVEPLLELPIENNNTPTLNGGGMGRTGIYCFALQSYHVSTILSLIASLLLDFH